MVLGSRRAKKSLINRFIKNQSREVSDIDKVKPTMGFEVEETKIDGKSIKLWDLSGETSYRGIWKNYLTDCDVAVIMVDGTQTNSEHFDELRKVFCRIDFGIIKSAICLISKSDLPAFNPLPIIDFLKGEGVYDKLANVDIISANDADLNMKMEFLITNALKKQRK